MKNTEKHVQEQELLQEIQHLKKMWGKTIERNLKNDNLEEVNSNNKYLDRLYPST